VGQRHRRATEPALIGRDHPGVRGERVTHSVPHSRVDRESVQQNQRQIPHTGRHGPHCVRSAPTVVRVSPVLPEIRTERLLLRRLWPTDEDKVVALYRDEEANQWDPMAFQPEQVRERFTGWVADWDDYGLSYWLAEATDNGAVVGMGGVRHHVEGGERVLNLAYRLHRNYWGQGYATEIARPAVEWAEQEMPDVPVSIVTTPQHAASLRVAEKLGFTVWRERSQHGFDEVLLRRQR